MSEKKEKQWAVLFFNTDGHVYRIRWWDARRDARAAAKKFNDNNKGNGTLAKVQSMQRGDGG